MMIYQEKIAPPVTVKEQKLIAETLASDDRWIKNLIAGLAGILERSSKSTVA
jgi:hypothetical protein